MTSSDEAARALALYRPNAKEVGRPFERFLVHAGRLQGELEKNGEAMREDPKVAEGVRKHLFMLEGLLRLYQERGPKKKLQRALETIKALEDTIGAFGYASDMRAAAAGATDLNAKALARLDLEVDEARDKLERALEDGWRPQPGGRIERLDYLVDTFAKIDFGSVKEDVRFVRARLAELCHDVAHKPLDMTDLEGGVHELRRKLRWIPITLMALEGLVTLDERSKGPIAAFERLKQDPVAQTPFARLPVTDADQAHIEIPWTLFLALSKAIGDLGKIKDRGQQLTALAPSLGEREQLRPVLDDAATLNADLRKSGLLEALATAFAG